MGVLSHCVLHPSCMLQRHPPIRAAAADAGQKALPLSTPPEDLPDKKYFSKALDKAPWESYLFVYCTPAACSSRFLPSGPLQPPPARRLCRCPPASSHQGRCSRRAHLPWQPCLKGLFQLQRPSRPPFEDELLVNSPPPA
jgi:hypothetical protein